MADCSSINEFQPVRPDTPIPAYCAFIDVLGYGALVKNEELGYVQVSNCLNSLYANVIGSVGTHVLEINERHGGVIKTWSFSDSVYMQSADISMLIAAIGRIFNDVFNQYRGFKLEDEWTPMLRCGIAKGWVHEFRSFSAVANKRSETTPVGPGVANAYWAAEKSGVSGMRIIITEEVWRDIGVSHMGLEPFEYYAKEIAVENVLHPYYFKVIDNRASNLIGTLYELLWPADTMGNTPNDYVSELIKLRETFASKHLRHIVDTAKLMVDSMDIAPASFRERDIYARERARLDDLIRTASREADQATR